MFNTLQNSINFASPYIQYSPLTAGFGMEPAASIASMVRNSFFSQPMSWFFNRAEISFPTVVGQQDYTIATAPDLAYVEKVSLTDDAGNIYEIKDVYDNQSLSPSSFQQRPNAMSIQTAPVVNGVQNYKFRFLGVPDQIYTVTIEYQKLSPQFGPFFITSCASASGGSTAYTGSFDTLSFPVGATAVITGFKTNVGNNGSFVVASCTPTVLTLVNSAGIAETPAAGAFANNFSWAPIPNQYSDVYNNLFLSEVLATVDDARAQLYRQRGVAAMLAKATGLTEMQKNAFAQQWLARGVERQSLVSSTQSGNAGRGI